ncbi:MAG: hypothetical protein R3E79_00390 [Caldilineaceae bacterium]
MSNRKPILFVWLFLLCLITSCQPAAWFRVNYPDVAAYGEKVRFAEDHPIRFPDFTLTYRGRRHVASDKFPRL